MPYLIAASFLSMVTLSVIKARSDRSRRATLSQETDEPALFI
jgi:hypothetical protein